MQHRIVALVLAAGTCALLGACATGEQFGQHNQANNTNVTPQWPTGVNVTTNNPTNPNNPTTTFTTTTPSNNFNTFNTTPTTGNFANAPTNDNTFNTTPTGTNSTGFDFAENPTRPNFASGAAFQQPAMQGGNYRPTVDQAPTREAATVNVMRVTFADEGGDFDPALSRDGSTLFFASTQHREQADIYSKRVDGRVVTRLTTDPGQDVMPAISPDGQMIAFASDRTGNWDIFVMPASGGRAVQVTNGLEADIAPSWSPDGRQLVFSRLGQSSNRWEMWVARVSKPDTASFIGYGLFPKWCPTPNTAGEAGDKIVFQQGRERGNRTFSIWTLDYTDGVASNPTEIVRSGSDALINPNWSPDGRFIVYSQVPLSATNDAGFLNTNTTPASASLWMVSDAGEGNMRLTTGPGLALSPSWAGNNRLFFVSNRGGAENIWAMDVRSAVQVSSALMNPAPAPFATAPNVQPATLAHPTLHQAPTTLPTNVPAPTNHASAPAPSQTEQPTPPAQSSDFANAPSDTGELP